MNIHNAISDTLTQSIISGGATAGVIAAEPVPTDSGTWIYLVVSLVVPVILKLIEHFTKSKGDKA